jgi:hypothetical protein
VEHNVRCPVQALVKLMVHESNSSMDGFKLLAGLKAAFASSANKDARRIAER